MGVAATPDGHGYWLVAADGGVFTFGDAAFYGSAGGGSWSESVTGLIPDADGAGYTLVDGAGATRSYP